MVTGEVQWVRNAEMGTHVRPRLQPSLDLLDAALGADSNRYPLQAPSRGRRAGGVQATPRYMTGVLYSTVSREERDRTRRRHEFMMVTIPQVQL
jgi:hypothetical protein